MYYVLSEWNRHDLKKKWGSKWDGIIRDYCELCGMVRHNEGQGFKERDDDVFGR